MKTEFAKIKLTKTNTLEVDFIQSNDEGSVIASQSASYKPQVHNDLKLCYEQLIPHWLILTGLKEEKEFKDYFGKFKPAQQEGYVHNSLANFHVSQYKIGGAGEEQGITLTGQKTLRNSKSININSPFYTWAEIDKDYEYAVELRDLITQIEDEARQYMEGKFDDTQMSVFEKEA